MHILSHVSVVTHCLLNLSKRLIVVASSSVVFGHPLTATQLLGLAYFTLGLLLFCRVLNARVGRRSLALLLVFSVLVQLMKEEEAKIVPLKKKGPLPGSWMKPPPNCTNKVM